MIRKDTSFDPSVLASHASIQEIYGALANDIDRLGLVLADIRELVREDRALVVLTERREHLDRIANSVREEIPNLVVLHGGIKPKARRAAMTQLAEQPDDEPRLILATGRYLGEGFDDPRLDTLLLTLPIAWKGTVVQYAGRLNRAHSPSRIGCTPMVFGFRPENRRVMSPGSGYRAMAVSVPAASTSAEPTSHAAGLVAKLVAGARDAECAEEDRRSCSVTFREVAHAFPRVARERQGSQADDAALPPLAAGRTEGVRHKRGCGVTTGHIMAALGDRSAATITPAEVDAVLRTVGRSGMAPRTLNHTRETLGATFSYGTSRRRSRYRRIW